MTEKPGGSQEKEGQRPDPEERRRLYRRVWRYSAIGLEMGFSVAIGAAMGYYLDRYFGTGPWLTLVFLILGAVAGFRSLFSLIKEIGQDEKKGK